jgi:hypothetical protein
MKKQTAVEWYENKLIELDIDFGGHKNYWIERKKIRDQANAMEKELIIDVHLHAQFKVVEVKKELAEKYYNDFYGGDDE